MNFYTNKQAAAAIAAEIYPDNAEKREAVAYQYQSLIWDALIAGALIGRDLDARIPIDPSRPGRVLVFQHCLIGEADLNAWLQTIGVGVQVSAPASLRETRSGALDWYPTAHIADSLADFLVDGKNKQWLKDVLGDAAKRPGLAECRRQCTAYGALPGSYEWNPSLTVFWLRKKKYISDRSARQALQIHYPDYFSMSYDE